jgi:hypothetical protein
MLTPLGPFTAAAAYHQHRDVQGMAHRRHGLPEDQVVHAAVSVGTHDQHIDAGCHGIDDQIGRMPVQKQEFNGQVSIFDLPSQVSRYDSSSAPCRLQLSFSNMSVPGVSTTCSSVIRARWPLSFRYRR